LRPTEAELTPQKVARSGVCATVGAHDRRSRSQKQLPPSVPVAIRIRDEIESAAAADERRPIGF